MAIGRPIELTPNIATKNISTLATDSQTQFTVTGGYRINEIAVYRNGVRLAEGRDFTASDGDTVNLVTAAEVDDVIEFAVFDSFNISDAIVSAASTQSLNGDFNVTGNLYAGTFKPASFVATAATFNSTIHVGTALTADASGNLNTVGVVTASSFSGDGSALTGLANTDFVVSVATTTGNLNVSAAATITGVIDSNATTDSTSSTTGAITAAGGVGIAKDLFVGDAIDVTKDLKVGAAATITGALSGSTGAFSGAVNVDATTDSTSVSTGALIVDGGLGVAKNVYIGAGLSVAGTLTYEDVTSVDSVGLITAKSGVNITGGELTVGSGITMGIAGVATFSGTADVHLKDNVRLNVGDGSDLAVYHDGTHSYITNSTGDLKITDASAMILASNSLRLKNGDSSQAYLAADNGAAVELYYNANKKFETTNDGTVTTGIATATSFSGSADIPTGGAFTVGSGITMAATSGVVTFANGSTTTNALHFGSPAELKIYHDGSNHYIRGEGDGLLSVRQMGTGDVELFSNMDARIRVNGGETAIECNYNSSVDLYHNNNKKFETTSSGVSVTGTVAATNYTGDGSALTGVGGEFDITSCLFV